jgi:catechol 2,3-dioxygenase-like lactoylglutathione lyase family enzyme
MLRRIRPEEGSVFTATAAFSGFSVDDTAAARTFYGDVLGIETTDNPMGFLELVLGSGARVLVYEKPGHVPAEYTVLNFPVLDIDDAVDDLRARGVETKIYPDSEFRSDERGIVRGAGRGPDIAWFRDPAGNILSVLQA